MSKLNLSESERCRRSMSMTQYHHSRSIEEESSRSIGKKNLQRALLWIYFHGATTRKLLTRVNGKTNHSIVSRLSKNGFIKEVFNPCSSSEKLIILSELGIFEASRTAEKFEMDDSFSYKPKTGSATQQYHDLLAQKIVLDLRDSLKEAQGNIRLHHYISNHQLNSQYMSRDKTPDAIAAFSNDSGDIINVAIEVELSKKTGRKLDQFTSRIDQSLRRSQYQRCYIYVSSNRHKEHYEKAFRQQKAHVWNESISPRSNRFEHMVDTNGHPIFYDLSTANKLGKEIQIRVLDD